MLMKTAPSPVMQELIFPYLSGRTFISSPVGLKYSPNFVSPSLRILSNVVFKISRYAYRPLKFQLADFSLYLYPFGSQPSKSFIPAWNSSSSNVILYPKRVLAESLTPTPCIFSNLHTFASNANN